MNVPRADFEELVAEALDSLPEDIAAAMDNVEIVVEDDPPPDLVAELPDGDLLLGYYHGVPLTARYDYGGVLPDKISIYRRPILTIARSADAIREQVRRTVIHEIAHHFGIDDDRLDELGWS